MNKKAAKGTELRDRSWAMISRSVLDLPPRFIADMRGDRPILDTAVNGLIRTQKGYYRLAEDTRDGTRVLLHSYERDQLTGEKQRDREGAVYMPRLAPDEYHVYAISARKELNGGIFRDDINHDMRYLEKAFQKDLNLHVAEFQVGRDGHKKQVVKLANGRGAFGIFETGKGKWKVRYYRNLRKGKDPAERFTTVDEANPGIFARLFSMGRDVKTFNAYPDALKYVRKEWNQMSLDIYKGKSIDAEIPSLRVKVLSKVLDFFEQRKYRDWIVSGLVGVATGILAAPHATPLLTAVMGGVGGAGWVLGGHAVENFLYRTWFRHAAKRDDLKLEALKPYFEKNDVEKYLIQSPENRLRFRRKIDPKAVQYLRLLNHEESDINYDGGPFTPAVNPQRPLEDLSSTAYRYYGGLFDSSEHERGLLAASYPNGMLTLTQVDPKTHATRHYLTFRKDFDEQEGVKGQQRVDTGASKLPSTGPIHKITHKQGRMFGYIDMKPEEFLADLMHKTGNDAKDIRFFGMKLTELFNVKSPEKIRARTKDSQTIEEIRALRAAAAPPAPSADPRDFVAPPVKVPGLPSV